MEAENKFGLQPVEFKVLIEPDEVDEVAGRDKIIIMPDIVRDQRQMTKVQGTLLAVGGNAFEEWLPPIPQVGDKVYFAKYAGLRIKNNDGEIAVLCNDKDIAGILHEADLDA